MKSPKLSSGTSLDPCSVVPRKEAIGNCNCVGVPDIHIQARLDVDDIRAVPE